MLTRAEHVRADPVPHARRRSAVLALVAMILALLLGACSAADQASSAGGGSDGAGSEDEAALAEAADGEAGAVGAPGADVLRAQADAAPGRMIARDASVRLVVDDVTQAAGQVRAAAAAADGYVVSEEVTPGDADADGERDDGGYAMFVLSVPSASLDQAVDRVGDLGTVVSSDMTSKDVTEQYVDTTARIETLQASVDRVRALLGEAGTVKDIVALERELSDREAELDALRAVQQSLEADVSRSSLTVELHTDEAAVVAAAEDPSGFVAGLQRGWSAFGAATATVLTGLGAVLPFAIALAVLLLPVLWWQRRRATHAGAARPGPDSTAGHEADQLRA
ncbi:MAG: DUF4349 domain-containing protein [Ornithinimicrobium sp.]|uniref:DUF4349 domain-containing protein n=1 Tax=Ornithinimicrobium sp. TaxID=1977084 RepID=UPI003D9BCA45